LLHGFTKETAAVEEADKRIGRHRMAQHAAMKSGPAVPPNPEREA
jgi:hypothetical protein